MQHGDAALGAERAETVLELAGLVQRLVDERFDDRLAERGKLAASEPAEKALHSGEAYLLNLDRLLVEHGHSSIVEDLGDGFRLTALIIMIAEDSEDRNRAGADV